MKKAEANVAKTKKGTTEKKGVAAKAAPKSVGAKAAEPAKAVAVKKPPIRLIGKTKAVLLNGVDSVMQFWKTVKGRDVVLGGFLTKAEFDSLTSTYPVTFHRYDKEGKQTDRVKCEGKAFRTTMKKEPDIDAARAILNKMATRKSGDIGIILTSFRGCDSAAEGIEKRADAGAGLVLKVVDMK